MEWCKSVSSIKYILKYINKGPDYASFAVMNDTGNIDEITNFQTGRYINSNEAVWKIFGFDIHGRHPSIQHLDVHLENHERVFTEANASKIVENHKPTTLTAFFNLCSRDNFAKTILYGDVSKYYTFDKGTHEFKKRRRGKLINEFENIMETNNLSRMYTINPKNRECYYLRLLLNNRVGPTSFVDLKTIDNVTYETYQETCLKLGLIGDDQEWTYAMEESQLCQSPKCMRNIFTIILSFCEVNNPKELWDKFWKSMSEDFLYQITRSNEGLKGSMDVIAYSLTYNEINTNIFNTCGRLLNTKPKNFYECRKIVNLITRNILQLH